MAKYSYIKNGIKYEKCIKCAKKTNVKFETPIKNRDHFIENSGQLCKGCYETVFKSEEII